MRSSLAHEIAPYAFYLCVFLEVRLDLGSIGQIYKSDLNFVMHSHFSEITVGSAINVVDRDDVCSGAQKSEDGCGDS